MTIDENSETALRVRYHEINQVDKDQLAKIRKKCLRLSNISVSDIREYTSVGESSPVTKVYTSVGESLPCTTKGETVECKCDTDEEEVF